MFRSRMTLRVCAVAALVSIAGPAAAQSTGLISGFVYVDRNNDGQLAFNDSANPELVIPAVSVNLFAINNATATLLRTIQTDAIGRYIFDNLTAGTYRVTQTQPIEFLDGLDTIGHITTSSGGSAPVGSSAGTAGADRFDNIVLTSGALGHMYNFGERGLLPAYVSKRYLLGTAPPPVVVAPNDAEVGVDETVPEPASALLATGLFGWLAWRRRCVK